MGTIRNSKAPSDGGDASELDVFTSDARVGADGGFDELAFDIEQAADGVTVSARTSAAFPGVWGRLYRALVIGTGGHALVVRAMLKRIAHAATR